MEPPYEGVTGRRGAGGLRTQPRGFVFLTSPAGATELMGDAGARREGGEGLSVGRLVSVGSAPAELAVFGPVPHHACICPWREDTVA